MSSSTSTTAVVPSHHHHHSSSSSSPDALKINPSTVIEIGGTYIRKMVGVDFLVKLIGYLVRFKILALTNSGSDPVQLQYHKKLLGSIVESRMLSNAGKWPSTFVSATKLAEAPEDFVNKERNLSVPGSHELDWLPSLSNLTCASPLKLISYLALLCRTLEQLSSDGGYLSRYVFFSWNRERLTMEYKRWKSFSLTCLITVEIIFLIRFIQQKLEARNNSNKNNNSSTNNKKSGEKNNKNSASTNSSSSSSDDITSTSASTTTPSTSSPAYEDFPSPGGYGSPSGDATHKRSVSTVEFQKAKGVEELHRLAVPALTSPKFKYRFQHIASGAKITSSDAINSLIVATRCACDMYIYYRWIPSWNPPEFWQYSAGIVSAVLGIYLVLEETIGDVKKNHQTANSKVLAHAADQRKKQE